MALFEKYKPDIEGSLLLIIDVENETHSTLKAATQTNALIMLEQSKILC